MMPPPFLHTGQTSSMQKRGEPSILVKALSVGGRVLGLLVIGFLLGGMQFFFLDPEPSIEDASGQGHLQSQLAALEQLEAQELQQRQANSGPFAGLGPREEKPRTSIGKVAWQRECGCTGMDVEAVGILMGLVAKIGSQKVITNRCEESCAWPAATRAILNKIEVPEANLWPHDASKYPKPGEKYVYVVHQAFIGVCGLPETTYSGFGFGFGASLKRAPGVYLVSRSMYETDRLQPGSAESCNSIWDAVWVTSKFNKRTFEKSGVKSTLLQRLPESVDTAAYTCEPRGADPSRALATIQHSTLKSFLKAAWERNSFTFVSVFKWEERKNWRALIKAFAENFPTDHTPITLEDGTLVKATVRLVIKTKYLSWGTDPQTDLEFFFRTTGEILDEEAVNSVKSRLLVVQDDLGTEAMPALYKACDAFVLPTRGEGWGLPIIEAMASGLPTIATNFGGQTEYMTKENSWPLPFTMVPQEEWDPSSHRWAEVKYAELGQAMREVVGRSNAVREKVQQACKDIHTNYSPGAVADKLEKLLMLL